MPVRFLLLLYALCLTPTASAQARVFDQVAAAHPDMTGVWQANGRTQLERPAGLDTLVVPEDIARREEAAALAKAQTATGATANPDLAYVTEWHFSTVRGEKRSSRITKPANGRLPLTAEGKRIAESSKKDSDGPEGRSTEERCLTGLGATPLGGSVGEMGFYQIVQTRDHLAIQSETGGVVRIVGIGSAPRPAAMLSLLGDSIAKWDGDTLFVETTKVSSWDMYWPAVRRPPILRPEGRLIERFTLIAADELLYQFTIEDPAIYSEPWSAEFVLTRSSQCVRVRLSRGQLRHRQHPPGCPEIGATEKVASDRFRRIGCVRYRQDAAAWYRQANAVLAHCGQLMSCPIRLIQEWL